MGFKRFYHPELEALQKDWDKRYKEWFDFEWDYQNAFRRAIRDRFFELVNKSSEKDSGYEVSFIDDEDGRRHGYGKGQGISLGYFIEYGKDAHFPGQKMQVNYYLFLDLPDEGTDMYLTRIDHTDDEIHGVEVDREDYPFLYHQLAGLGFFDDDFISSFEVL